MPIDPNIILQLQGPRIDNPMDVAAKAMTMKQLANQTQLQDQQIAEQNAMRDAFQKNITMNPDGTTSLNRKAALSDLYKANPMKAMEAEKSFHQMDQEEQKMKLEKVTKDLSLTGQLLGSVRDQATYDQAKAQAQAYGLDISKLPAAYDPNYIKQMQMQTLSVQDQIGQLWKQKEFDLNSRKGESEISKNKAETAKLYSEAGKKANGLTKGDEKAAEEFAKDYNDWTSSGRSAVEKNLQRLYEAKAALATDDTLTGPIRGLTPDFVRNGTNEKAIQTRDNVRAAAQGALKATLGSAFTEKEGERIMNQAYNEKLSEQANIDKLNTAIRELEANRDAMEKKAKHFEKYGSLKGYQGAQSTSGFVLMKDPQGNVRQIPADQVEAAKAAGGQPI